MANSVPQYRRPTTEVDESFLLSELSPSLAVHRKEIKSSANPQTARVMREANDIVAGHPRPEWKNLCSEALWGRLMGHVEASGARLLRGWQLHFLDSRPDRLETLRACAAELMYRWKELKGVYLTAQVALDVMTVRVIDETWSGFQAERASTAVLKDHLPALAKWAGYAELFLRDATAAEDSGSALDKVVVDYGDNPIIGWQIKNGRPACNPKQCKYGCPAYFRKTEAGTRFHKDKVANIRKNNLWLDRNPTAITVRYLCGNDLLANRLRTIRDDSTHEVSPAGIRLKFRVAAKGALATASS